MPSGSNDEMPIAIIGPGALGSLLGGLFVKHGYRDVQFWGRHGPIHHQFEMEGWLSQSSSFDFPLHRQSQRPIELVILAVKCYDIATALEAHRCHPALRQVRSILIVSNGMMDQFAGNHASVSQCPLFLATTTFGVKQVRAGSYTAVNPSGWIVSGPDSGFPSPVGGRLQLEAFFRAMGHPGWHWRSDSREWRQKKWLMNTSLNSICGKYRLPNNISALQHERELQAIFDESFRLAERLWGPFREPARQLWNELIGLVEATAANENSMAQDVRLGRKTEIDFLAGLYRQDPDGSYPLMEAMTKELSPVSPG